MDDGTGFANDGKTAVGDSIGVMGECIGAALDNIVVVFMRQLL